jgi:hypothetical protein
MFYSMTGGGTSNITLIGTSTGPFLFNLGGVSDDDNDSSSNGSVTKSKGFIVGMSIAAVVVFLVAVFSIW